MLGFLIGLCRPGRTVQAMDTGEKEQAQVESGGHVFSPNRVWRDSVHLKWLSIVYGYLVLSGGVFLGSIFVYGVQSILNWLGLAHHLPWGEMTAPVYLDELLAHVHPGLGFVVGCMFFYSLWQLVATGPIGNIVLCPEGVRVETIPGYPFLSSRYDVYEVESRSAKTEGGLLSWWRSLLRSTIILVPWREIASMRVYEDKWPSPHTRAIDLGLSVGGFLRFSEIADLGVLRHRLQSITGTERVIRDSFARHILASPAFQLSLVAVALLVLYVNVW